VIRLRTKSMALTDLALGLADDWLSNQGFRVASPRLADRRGSHITLEHPDARTLCSRLAEVGVITDFRTPDRIRLGMAALTTSFTDVVRAMQALRSLTQ
jgi:kynureninase